MGRRAGSRSRRGTVHHGRRPAGNAAPQRLVSPWAQHADGNGNRNGNGLQDFRDNKKQGNAVRPCKRPDSANKKEERIAQTLAGPTANACHPAANRTCRLRGPERRWSRWHGASRAIARRPDCRFFCFHLGGASLEWGQRRMELARRSVAWQVSKKSLQAHEPP